MLNVGSRYCEIAVAEMSNSQCFMTKRASHDMQLWLIKHRYCRLCKHVEVNNANYTTGKKGL